jgi:hypothetical protein
LPMMGWMSFWISDFKFIEAVILVTLYIVSI